ncbi:helix-turn-helix domain-containing protein [Nonomuraea sp. H19]|uniref:helix-turn-helix domain-containing protein n=1 Tax=Nonomuraea sp. H19 TaxID=3452206 RepID=UPI003F8B4B7C
MYGIAEAGEVLCTSLLYGQRGGYTPAEQERRERVRLQAGEWFEAGESIRTVAARLRVHEQSVTRWRKAWREGARHGCSS